MINCATFKYETHSMDVLSNVPSLMNGELGVTDAQLVKDSITKALFKEEPDPDQYKNSLPKEIKLS